MSEYFEHNPNDHEDPLTAPTWLLGIVGAILLVVIVLGLAALYYNTQSRLDEERLHTPELQQLRTMRERQRAKLQGPPRSETREIAEDVEEEVFIIPIEDAMDQIVREYGSRSD